MSVLTVIGVGNPLFGDDGVGIAVIEALRATQLDMELIDGGTDALGLLEYFADRKRLVIVDAARMGEKPGAVRCFDPAEADLILKWDHLSLHGVGLAEAWQLATKLDMLPEKLWVIGVQPGVVRVTNHLSVAVRNAVPIVVTLIKKFVRYGEELPCNEPIKDNPSSGFSKEVHIHG
ncbi:MAG: hydrogenase maturation protease [Candidatus Marinimicrobia bacterium]|nr:hydrogenase maturation protease [Candidatus Neomarinimicrobiota bacterium]MCF7902316.1 hydrogenase maturation protease [Candidatus Neomarinimicrobiota bacterium]